MADRVGQQLGNYRLIRLLGRGGFAEVYLGEHLRLNTQIALKVLHTSLEDDDAGGFLREAQTVARLRHPHIVRVFDFDVENHTPFLVMDYLPNGNVRRLHPKGTPLPLQTIVSYVRQMASALQYAHDEKVIHRDIKPENMLLDRDNTLVLSDFGIALMSQSSRYQSTQEVAGTAAYMAPEQFQGHPRRASDQYALAVVVYEWLTGERPFHGSFSEIASQHLFVPPPPLHEKVPMIPLGVEQVVQIALDKDHEQRFGSVQAFANALEQAWQTEQSLTTPTVLGLSLAPFVSLTRETPLSGLAPKSPVSTSVPSAQSTRGTQPSSFAPTPHASADKGWTPHTHGRTILLVGLALLVIVTSMGLFAIIHAKQIAALNASATATTSAAEANAVATQNAANATATAVAYRNLYIQSTSGNPVFSDPLSDNSNGHGWSGGNQCQFAGGVYNVSVANTNIFHECGPSPNINFSNFAYEVQMKIINGDDGGVAFRANANGGIYHGYLFIVGQNGYYQLCLAPLNSGSCSSLLSGFSGAINRGLNQTNLVTVITRGDTITLYVNQQEVGSLTNNTFSQGSSGVIAFDFGNPTKVAYSYAKVWTI